MRRRHSIGWVVLAIAAAVVVVIAASLFIPPPTPEEILKVQLLADITDTINNAQ